MRSQPYRPPAKRRPIEGVTGIEFLGGRLAKEEADKAIAWLTKAVAAGWADAAQMRKDTDLDFLRDREDFQKLLAELEKK